MIADHGLYRGRSAQPAEHLQYIVFPQAVPLIALHRCMRSGSANQPGFSSDDLNFPVNIAFYLP